VAHIYVHYAVFVIFVGCLFSLLAHPLLMVRNLTCCYGTSRWVSTGMLPQFLSIDLKLCWLIVDVSVAAAGEPLVYSRLNLTACCVVSQIKVVGYGIEKLTVSIEGSVLKVPMVRQNRCVHLTSL
jgi:hypothetical protein